MEVPTSRGSIDAGLLDVGMKESVVSVGRLGREVAGGEMMDEVCRDFDRVHHAALRVARMSVEAAEGDGDRVG